MASAETSAAPTDAPDVPRYRAAVGGRLSFDLMGATQFSLLAALGLRQEHRLCDVGCGSLRAGRLFIPYLNQGNYCGIEPRSWVLDEGLQNEVGADLVERRAPRFNHSEDFDLASFGNDFDFVLAQSVFSHTYRDLAATGLKSIAGSLAPGGILAATFIEEFPVILPRGVNHQPDDGSGFLHPGGVSYTWREWTAMLGDAGLVCRRIRWYHIRQTWFLAAKVGDEARLKEAFPRSVPRLRGHGMVGDAKRRAVNRLARLRQG